VSNIELPVPRKRAIDGKKCLRRVVPLITVAALSASLFAAAGPAIAAVRPSAAPIISVSGTGRPAVAVRTALNNVHRTKDGQFALTSAGLSGWALSADSAFVVGLNKASHQAEALDVAADNVVDAADAVPAANQGTTVITIVPGTTLTISSTEVVLDISSQDVTDIENAAGFGSAIAALVGAILSVAQVPDGPGIAGIVASSITVGSDALKLCAGNDGGSIILSVSAPRNELPSVSACGISV
jgi:hypothetical protein